LLQWIHINVIEGQVSIEGIINLDMRGKGQISISVQEAE